MHRQKHTIHHGVVERTIDYGVVERLASLNLPVHTVLLPILEFLVGLGASITIWAWSKHRGRDRRERSEREIGYQSRVQRWHQITAPSRYAYARVAARSQI